VATTCRIMKIVCGSFWNCNPIAYADRSRQRQPTSHFHNLSNIPLVYRHRIPRMIDSQYHNFFFNTTCTLIISSNILVHLNLLIDREVFVGLTIPFVYREKTCRMRASDFGSKCSSGSCDASCVPCDNAFTSSIRNQDRTAFADIAM